MPWFSRFHLSETAIPLFPKPKIRNAQLAFQCILNCRETKIVWFMLSIEAANANANVFSFIVISLLTMHSLCHTHSKCVRPFDWLVFDLLGLSCGVFCGAMVCLDGRSKISKWKFNEDINSGPWCHKYYRIQGFRCILVNGTTSRRPMPRTKFLCEKLQHFVLFTRSPTSSCPPARPYHCKWLSLSRKFTRSSHRSVECVVCNQKAIKGK